MTAGMTRGPVRHRPDRLTKADDLKPGWWTRRWRKLGASARPREAERPWAIR
jgi:hypothetical protein